MKILFAVLISILGIIIGSAQSCIYAQERTENWKKISNEYFQIQIPSDMKDENIHGIDTEVWKFNSEELILYIESGTNENYEIFRSDYINKPNFSEKSVTIDDRSGYHYQYYSDIDENKLLDEYKNKRYVTGIYFDRVKDKFQSIEFTIHGSTDQSRETADKIFQSIKFK